jgi:hypothetical protein
LRSYFCMDIRPVVWAVAADRLDRGDFGIWAR